MSNDRTQRAGKGMNARTAQSVVLYQNLCGGVEENHEPTG